MFKVRSDERLSRAYIKHQSDQGPKCLNHFGTRGQSVYETSQRDTGEALPVWSITIDHFRGTCGTPTGAVASEESRSTNFWAYGAEAGAMSMLHQLFGGKTVILIIRWRKCRNSRIRL